MAKVHGSWGHYVRPGRSDPVYNGSGWRYCYDDGPFSQRTDKESRKKGKAPRPAFIVYGRDGKVLYQCGKKKAAVAKARVIRMLPSGGYTCSGKVIRLYEDLSTLGYSSPAEFAMCCAGRQAELSESQDACVIEDVQEPTGSIHLDGREQRILERRYRVHGGDQGWKGWDTLLPGRSKSFLFEEVKRLGIDKPDDRTWTKVETRIFQKHWRDLREDSPEWRSLLPRKSSAGIAYGYRQGGFEPSGAEAQVKARPGGKKRGRRRRKPWHRVEDDALRQQFAVGETEMHQIKRALPYRSVADIKLRIQELGLDEGAPGGQESDNGAIESHNELRDMWASALVKAYYRIYGPNWGQWLRIVPWLSVDGIARLAASIGAYRPWSDEEQEQFLSNAGVDCTLDEFNVFIQLSPILDHESELWECLLPNMSVEDRERLLELATVPTKDEIDKLESMAERL